MTDMVNHPSHYGGADDPFETIKVLKAWLSPEEFRGFLMGNCIKYQSRLGKKGSRAEDAGKAAFYATALAEFEEERRFLEVKGKDSDSSQPEESSGFEGSRLHQQLAG